MTERTVTAALRWERNRAGVIELLLGAFYLGGVVKQFDPDPASGSPGRWKGWLNSLADDYSTSGNTEAEARAAVEEAAVKALEGQPPTVQQAAKPSQTPPGGRSSTTG